MNEAAARSIRGHLSIGEVLNLLQDEFPDITISKIRFLESQGLIDPERTPSGYRKFYEADIARLRWILVQQRENFLPLKVIKERLEGGELDLPDDSAPEPPPGADRQRPTPAELDLESDADPDRPSPPDSATPAADQRTERSDRQAPEDPSGRPAPVIAISPDPGSSPETTNQAFQPSDPGPGRGAARSTRDAVRAAPHDAGVAAVALTRDELADAAGITPADVADLERFGLLTGRPIGPTVLYDEAALGVARLAAGFIRHGAEGRHLRMYKVAAEREASFFEQVLMPLLKQRHPEARQQAVETLGELAELGEGLRAAMLHNALRDYLGSP